MQRLRKVIAQANQVFISIVNCVLMRTFIVTTQLIYVLILLNFLWECQIFRPTDFVSKLSLTITAEYDDDFCIFNSIYNLCEKLMYCKFKAFFFAPTPLTCVKIIFDQMSCLCHMISPPCLWKNFKWVCKNFAHYVPFDDFDDMLV